MTVPRRRPGNRAIILGGVVAPGIRRTCKYRNHHRQSAKPRPDRIVRCDVTTGQLGDQFHRLTGVPGTTPHRLPPRTAGEVEGRRRRPAQRARPRRRPGPCDRGSRGWSPRRRWLEGPGSGGAGGFRTLVSRWRHCDARSRSEHAFCCVRCRRTSRLLRGGRWYLHTCRSDRVDT